MRYVKKPGYMFRACIAWTILNGVLLFTLAALVYILSENVSQWFVTVPIIVGVVVSEWIIMAETIAPIIKDWIKQEECVHDNEKPTWERPAPAPKSDLGAAVLKARGGEAPTQKTGYA